jgi:hypothetical protein
MKLLNRAPALKTKQSKPRLIHIACYLMGVVSAGQAAVDNSHNMDMGEDWDKNILLQLFKKIH